MTNYPLQLLSFAHPPREWVAELPKDWQKALTEMYQNQAQDLECLILAEGGHWRAAGIICRMLPWDMETYRKQLGKYMSSGHLYIGFLWTFLGARQQGWGSQWLQKVKQYYPSQGLWLTVEEATLIPFYERNGFHEEQCLGQGTAKEWVLVYHKS